jgi:peptidoglycan/xylan/chitin deacetylase (PgdA/CDA1 family)
MGSVTVLMYHHVNPLVGDMVTVHPSHFEAQMAYIKKKGYRTIHCEELADFMEGREDLPARTLMITFDDGFLDNYSFAFPILKDYGHKATIFAVTGWVDSASKKNFMPSEYVPIPHREAVAKIKEGKTSGVMMTWDHAREMEASNLVRVESHTHEHIRYDSGQSKELDKDLRRSKTLIEVHLKRPCEFLCWPWGAFDQEKIDLAKDLGYKALFTTLRGINVPGGDLSRIKRISVKDTMPGWWLRKTLFIFSRPWLGKAYARVKKE